MIRIYRIPFSTNVERVALALAHKGVEVEWIDVDPADRAPVRAASGQELVPVLESDGEVVADSTAILRWLEARHPEPPLWTRDRARQAETDVFLDWFDRVWKRPPNELEVEEAKPVPDRARMNALATELRGSLDLFEALLDGRAFLLGDLSAADCAAFPFLKYALLHDPADTERFHAILAENLALDGHDRLGAWIRRVDALPRA